MSSGRLVFLTGATGFIGGRLAQRLAAQGDRLRCYVRASSDPRALQRMGAEIVTGDITDADALARAMAGTDLAYHLAAIYDLGVVDADALERSNVAGTRAFLQAVERARPASAVYVSTTLALAPSTNGEGDESSEHPGPPYASTYERTKVAAHRLAREAQHRGLPLMIAAPAYVYGPGDKGPAGRVIEDILGYRLPGLPLGGSWFSFVYVDDVVDGLVRIGQRGRIGESYVLSGEAARFTDYAVRVARLGHKRPPPLRFPYVLVRLTGMILDPLSRLLGVRLPITVEGADTVARSRRYLHSHAKATRELDWHPRPLEQGLAETVSWFVAQRSQKA